MKRTFKPVVYNKSVTISFKFMKNTIYGYNKKTKTIYGFGDTKKESLFQSKQYLDEIFGPDGNIYRMPL